MNYYIVCTHNWSLVDVIYWWLVVVFCFLFYLKKSILVVYQWLPKLIAVQQCTQIVLASQNLLRRYSSETLIVIKCYWYHLYLTLSLYQHYPVRVEGFLAAKNGKQSPLPQLPIRLLPFLLPTCQRLVPHAAVQALGQSFAQKTRHWHRCCVLNAGVI